MDDETVSKPQSSDKIVETPQMKAIREKMLQKQIAKSSLSSSKTSTKLTEKKTVTSSTKISNLAKNNEMVDKNDNEITTFTPQMSVLYEKIQQRNLNKSNPDKKCKMNAKSKQEDLNIISPVSMKIQENQEKSTRHQETVNQNKNNIDQGSNSKTQNAQKSYSQNISSN